MLANPGRSINAIQSCGNYSLSCWRAQTHSPSFPTLRVGRGPVQLVLREEAVEAAALLVGVWARYATRQQFG